MLRAARRPSQAIKHAHRRGAAGTLHRRMKQHIAVSAIGNDRTGMVHDLSRVITDCGGSISESRMAALGSEFAMLLLVSGNWHSLAKLEGELAKLATDTGLSLHIKRTEPKPPRAEMVPYSVDAVCLDQTGIVSGLSGFFSTRGIDIAEVATRTYPAPHTGAQMFAIQMIANVPKRVQLSQLREEFLDYCDSINLDAILEPVKP
jgi:glycine cleavage system transcriptional repressor